MIPFFTESELLLCLLGILVPIICFIVMRRSSWSNKPPRRRTDANIDVMIVLGSGPHKILPLMLFHTQEQKLTFSFRFCIV
jgi:hypothetical protein